MHVHVLIATINATTLIWFCSLSLSKKKNKKNLSILDTLLFWCDCLCFGISEKESRTNRLPRSLVLDTEQ